MKTLLTLVLGVGLVAMLPASGFSQCTPLECLPEDANEGHFSGYNAHASAAGTFVVGEAFTAYQTLDAVNPNAWYPWNDAAFEYTLVITGNVSSYLNMPNVFRAVSFANTTFAIYEDAGTAANPALPGTYTDGAAILTGVITGMYAEGAGGAVDGIGPPASVPDGMGICGTVTFTGGSGLAELLCTSLHMADFLTWLPLPGGFPAGYKEVYNSGWLCCGTIGVDGSSWGGVKSLYR
jgi:hypothetical protein